LQGGDPIGELKLVVFDLSGTTLQDNDQVPKAFSMALNEYGLSISPEQLNSVRGSSKRQALLQLMPRSNDPTLFVEKVYAAFRAHLAQQYAETGVVPIQGAEETFQMLRNQGVRVALTTGFDRDTTTFLLDRLGWTDGIVDAVVCGDEVIRGRPAPYMIFHAMEGVGVEDVHCIANVGDTFLDLQAGYNAGAYWNVGVLSGAHDQEALERAPHTHIIPSVETLFDVWK
jgi:phosphonatase-like hydrolase